MTDTASVSPIDQFNAVLMANTHPADWQNPIPARKYNMVVLGGGTAGLVVALTVAAVGGKVAIVEKGFFGGDCLISGCVPSKAMLRSAHLAALSRSAGPFGIRIPEPIRVDFGAVMERMRKLRADISPHDSADRLRSMGVDVFFGTGRFSSKKTLEIDGKTTLKFSRACIATGSRPIPPPIGGLDEIDYLTTDTVFALTERPHSLAVIGAGPIGCEMAQAFARLGTHVELFDIAKRVLPHSDADASEIIARRLRADSVTIHLDCKISHAEPAKNTPGVTLHFPDGLGGKGTATFDRVFVAVGRAPAIHDLGLDRAGVNYDSHTGVHVNDKLATSNGRIFAAGDVCSAYKFTHAADALARIVVGNALTFPTARASALTIPEVTFTDPEVAHVGMSVEMAERHGILIDTMTADLAFNDRAVIDGVAEGFVRLHLKRGSDKILGATIVGERAGELIGTVTMAITAGLGLKKIARTIFPYPTQSEALRKLGDRYRRDTLGRLSQKLLAGWMHLRRWL